MIRRLRTLIPTIFLPKSSRYVVGDGGSAGENAYATFGRHDWRYSIYVLWVPLRLASLDLVAYRIGSVEI